MGLLDDPPTLRAFFFFLGGGGFRDRCVTSQVTIPSVQPTRCCVNMLMLEPALGP